jgi:hypothetical protein
MATPQENLETAKQIIKQSRAEIAEFEAAEVLASPDAEHDLYTAREQLQLAEEVASASALGILQAEVDAEARELVALNIRRAALLTSTRGFLALHIERDGKKLCPEISRMVSAALLERFDDPAAITAAAEGWKSRLDALLAS